MQGVWAGFQGLLNVTVLVLVKQLMVNITVCCGSVGFFFIHLSIQRNALEVWRRKCKRSNLRVLKVVTEKNLLVIMGCVPGHNKPYVIIHK
jgi:hypothetical protein